MVDWESKVIWTGTPLAEIYNGVESLRYSLIDEDGKSTDAIKKGGVILAVIRDYYVDDIQSGSLVLHPST